MIGFLVVDKPSGLTSHDVVMDVRRGTRLKSVGHAGTLDPMATGVLVLCLGDATRLSEYVMASDKTYEARLKLGVETDSYDADGQITAQTDASHLAPEQLTAAFSAFTGAIAQIPPMYSAIKQGGVALYKLARAGQEVERAPRPVTISELRLLDWTPAGSTVDATIRVTCSAGTYIRSLGHDLGAALGVGAHLTALRRTRSGALDQPVGWDALLASLHASDWRQYVIDEQLPLRALPSVPLDADQVIAIRHGKSLAPFENVSGLCRLYDPAGRLVAVAESRADRLQPVKVFADSSNE